MEDRIRAWLEEVLIAEELAVAAGGDRRILVVTHDETIVGLRRLLLDPDGPVEATVKEGLETGYQVPNTSVTRVDLSFSPVLGGRVSSRAGERMITAYKPERDAPGRSQSTYQL